MRLYDSFLILLMVAQFILSGMLWNQYLTFPAELHIRMPIAPTGVAVLAAVMVLARGLRKRQ